MRMYINSLLIKLKGIFIGILARRYATLSYSQEGEDLILNRIFAGKTSGFYIDVGAHHPFRFSNTYFFYRMNWRGINIEPNPDGISSFRLSRPRDVNLQMGVSDNNGVLRYHYFDEPALNTFDVDIVADRLSTTSYKVIRVEDIPVHRLDEILATNLPSGQPIDFLSIDVEGLDFRVLKSNDWTKYRPLCVLVEVLSSTLEGALTSDIHAFMKANKYSLFSRTYNTLIYKSDRV